ncbi:endonuclease domain-containing protein [Sphingomonas quercus]|uniref:Endonuclease domain-containing protein n=1 Tax=Sphingomonas quercus TaxID=2842451 RepID=A0ABS6BIK1_9SPHN|nr:DUF559 domain-containing protein [Sphingomonas quercus]MBU3078004.1 endonuclease domain-containing protein [Sphingomonas quercus]
MGEQAFRRCCATQVTPPPGSSANAVGCKIVDFPARSEKLVFEVDGDTHGRQTRYDAAHTAFLEDMGYRVIRFTNAEVMGNIEGVAQVIRPGPGPSPLGPRTPPSPPTGERA